MTRLGKQLDRLVQHSWLSAALGGRFTGSGAIFSGNELDKYRDDADKILSGSTAIVNGAKQDVRNAVGNAVNTAVGAHTPTTSTAPVSTVVRDAIIFTVVGGVIVYLVFGNKSHS